MEDMTVQDLANILGFMERSLATPFKNQAEVEVYQTLRNKIIATLNAMAAANATAVPPKEVPNVPQA